MNAFCRLTASVQNYAAGLKPSAYATELKPRSDRQKSTVWTKCTMRYTALHTHCRQRVRQPHPGLTALKEGPEGLVQAGSIALLPLFQGAKRLTGRGGMTEGQGGEVKQ